MSAMLGIGGRTSGSRRHRMSTLQPTGADRILGAGQTNKTQASQAVYQNMKKYAGEVQYRKAETRPALPNR